jgi:ABC-type branched-subunit amino acid transport system ATPase component
MNAILEVADIAKSYRGVTALDGVSLQVRKGSITGLIGPNGSGKSTLFDCISGFQPKDRGRVTLAGREIGGMPARTIARAGLRRTFQQLRVFATLSLRQNLYAAGQSEPGFSLAQEVFRTPAVRAHDAAMRVRADALLDQTGLAALDGHPAGGLSYGQKKLLELAMALMGRPRLLLLDEPMAGVNPTLIEGLKLALLAVRDQGISVLIIEHNLKLMFEICDWIHVLDRGRILAAGTPQAVAEDPRVIAAYLGTETQAEPALD